ncbi:Cytidylate kinase [Buchnera aphidicola (Panaphis juglandis)]
MKLPPVITIDGPSGSGKSVLSKELSKYLNWYHLESGMIYRIFACLFLQKKSLILKKNLIIAFKNLENHFIYKKGAIKKLINKNFKYNYIISNNITYTASKLATIKYVRKNLLNKQRLFRQSPGLITNGRDMGTIVFPDAILKFFLKAELKCRVQRRLYELKKRGFQINFQDIFLQMKHRDDRDTNRSYAPLQPSKNAIIIDSSKMTFKEVLHIAIKHIKKNQYI